MQVWHSGEPLALGGPKQRAVLAMLALNANRPVSQDALLGGLWGERASAGAVNAVQVYISRFRKEFDRVAPDGEDAELQRRGLGYVLLIKPDQIDLDRFEELADSGSRQVASAPRSAAAALREALDLWRGRALAEFAGMPFAEPEIARLAELHLVTVVARIDADLALGRHADLLAELELLAASHPLDERLHRRLILALYRAGRQADALHAYQRIRVRLTAELGRGPESTLRTLEQAVLAHDRRLDWRQVPDARPRMPAQPAPGRTAKGSPKPTTHRRPDAWNVPPRNPHFTGRTAVLQAVAERLAGGQHTLVVQALYGLGGVGKTQLAIEFAHRYAHRYRLVWWVDAEKPMMIGGQLARLAAFLDVPTHASVQETVREVLVSLSTRNSWLLIFDNAARAADVARYRPSGTGHILITSRAPGWGELGGRIGVDVLDRADTIGLLKSRIPAIDDLVAQELAAELGDLPLAVAQAVAHIEQSGMDPADYLARFSTRRSAFLARGEVLGYQGRVDTAWNISFERLRTAAPAALSLLTHSAFLGPEPIPQDLFGTHLLAGDEPAEPDALTDAIGAAAALSLLRRSPSGFQLHRLVQEVIRSHLAPAERSEVVADVVDMLAAAHPGDPNDPSTWPHYARLAPHVFAVGAAADRHPGARQLMLDTVAYFNTTSVNTARLLAGDVLQRWRRSLGAGHRDTLTLAAYLTLALMWDGAAGEAGKLGADTLAQAERELGPADPLTLRLASYSSCTLAWLAESTRARILATDTLARVERTYPAEHPDRLRLTAYLALALVWAGEPTSVAVATRARAKAREVLGPNHPTTLMTSADVALGLLTSADIGTTRAVGEDTMTRARSVFGERHLITLAAASVLTMALLWDDDLPRARRIGDELLTRASDLLGPDHVVSLTATAALTSVRAAASAEPTSVLAAAAGPAADDRAAVDRARRLLGPDHPITLITATAAARLLASGTADDRAAGSALAADTVDRVERGFSADHPLRRGLPTG